MLTILGILLAILLLVILLLACLGVYLILLLICNPVKEEPCTDSYPSQP
jgi:hypothetical protein